MGRDRKKNGGIAVVSAAFFRKKARECRQLAMRIRTDGVRGELLRMAFRLEQEAIRAAAERVSRRDWDDLAHTG